MRIPTMHRRPEQPDAGLERLAPFARLALAASLAVIVLPPDSRAIEAAEPPKPSRVVERAQVRLGQIDVSVQGPSEQIGHLTAADFELLIGGKDARLVAVDPMCGPPAATTQGKPVAALSSTTAPTSYLFYFDQRAMTPLGRANSIEMARGLVAKLVRGGNRAAIVSSGRHLDTVAGFTSDPIVLLAALDKLTSDPAQWDEYAAQESSRLDEIRVAIRYGEFERACSLAQTYQLDEMTRAQQSLALFRTNLVRFANVEPPKTAFYFADILRDRPGAHYLAVAGPTCAGNAGDEVLSFAPVHVSAAAYGVKVYGVEAQGMPVIVRGGEGAAFSAHGGLKALALDTGGDAFLNGASVGKMTERIERDTACLYLLSFDPSPYPEDKPLSVQVRVKARGVKIRTRSQTVIESESARKVATLMGAFTSPDTLKDPLPLKGGVVPLGVDGAELRVLAQVWVPRHAGDGAETWDLGMSLEAAADVQGQAASRLTASRAGVPLALESEMRIPKGTYSLHLVGMEQGSDRVAAGTVTGLWAGTSGATRVVPIAVLQPSEGAFVRDTKASSSGALVVPDGDSVKASLPTAFVALVCRSGTSRAPLHVQRALHGPNDLKFPATDVAVAEQPCAQIRDVVEAGALTAGQYVYEIQIDSVDALATRKFIVESAIQSAPRRDPHDEGAAAQP